jgi:nicotinate-nucleotide adenylyltransferase
VRTGILGGTFDPIHYGHLDVARAALDHMALDRVILLPSHTPPHRPVQPSASRFHRFAMVTLAACEDDRLFASDRELVAAGTSYTATTIDTLLHEGHSPSQLFFIAGADAFAEIATWYDYPALLDRCHFIVVSRPGHSVMDVTRRFPALATRMRLPGADGTDPYGGGPEPSAVQIFLVDAATRDVSSTAVRVRARAGLTLTDDVPPVVEHHIRKYGLYREHAPTAEGLHDQSGKQAQA